MKSLKAFTDEELHKEFFKLMGCAEIKKITAKSKRIFKRMQRLSDENDRRINGKCYINGNKGLFVHWDHSKKRHGGAR